MKQAKKIIAHFLKVTPSSIIESTIMDHTVIDSSILQHRMYALLADKGYVVEDFGSIKTYYDFQNIIEGHDINNCEILDITHSSNTIIEQQHIFNKNNISIGIDIENISNLPESKYYDDRFYKDNFTLYEIDYCKNKVNSRDSFTGLFSIKEAIVKADNLLINKPFNLISISHDSNGKPLYNGFELSIAHSDSYVVATAIKNNTFGYNQHLHNLDNKYFTRNEVLLVGLISIVFSVVINIVIG